MAEAPDQRGTAEVGRLLAGAARTIANAKNCWLAASGADGPTLRPMGRLQPEPDDDEWMIRFITDRRSHKASDIRHGGRVGLTFQLEGEDAFVAGTGPARLLESESEVR